MQSYPYLSLSYPINSAQVTAYPGESIKLVMLSFDEQNYTTSDIIQIFGVIHAKVSSNV